MVATAAEDGKSVCVFAVNRTSQPVQVSFDLGDHQGLHLIGGEAVPNTQDMRQPEVVNGWTNPDRIRTTELRPLSDGILLPPLSASAVESKKR